LVFSERALTDNRKKASPSFERYTIFHAIFEAVKDEKKINEG